MEPAPAPRPTRVLVPRQLQWREPPAGSASWQLSGRSMGCAWRVSYLDIQDSRTRQAEQVQALLQDIVDQMSTWEPHSCISRFNAAAAGSWTSLPPAFAMVLEHALRIAAMSQGAFDPTIAELTQLWGFGPGGRRGLPDFRVPADGEAAAVHRPQDWARLEFDRGARRLFQPGDLRLDLSAIAKGYAVDAVSRLLHQSGLPHHLVEIGGECRGSGIKADGQPWWVGLEGPGSGAAAATRIALHDLAVATSGDDVQAFEVAGHRYSHCLDPRTGRPLDNGVSSVTVLHRSCMLADAWATALMVLGPEVGRALAQRHDLAALWSVRSGVGIAEYSTPAFEAMTMDAASPACPGSR